MGAGKNKGHRGRDRITTAMAEQNATMERGALRFSLSERSVSIDASKLTSPTNTYDADGSWIDYQRGELSIYFVKTDRDDPSCLKSRIEVRYPPEDFLRTFWNNSIDFLAKVTSYASRWRPEIGQTGSVTSSPEKLKAQKSHSVWANYTYIAHAGTQAALDFYHVPPPGIARYAANQGTAGLELIPVVRVVISVFDLVDLFVKAKSVVEEIQSQLPAAEREKMDEPSRRAEEA